MSVSSWAMGETTPAKSLAKLRELGVDSLAEMIVNDALNNLISARDGGGIFDQADSTKMHIPYAGWYWRGVNFFGDWGVSIADAGGKTVICENNKWDYEERYLTGEERAEFLRLVWKALKKSREGGSLAEIHANTDKALKKAGAYIAGLSVNESDTA